MKSNQKRLLILIAVFALLLFMVPLLVSAQLAGSSLGAAPSQKPQNRNFDVQHYRLQLNFDWANKVIVGEATIELRSNSNNLWC